MKDPVQQLYDSMTEEGIAEVRNHTAPPVRFRASESSNCLRQIYHRLNGDRPAPRDARGLMYGICGDVDHDLTRQLFEGHGVKIGGVTFDDDGQATEHMFFRKDFDVETPAGNVTVQVTARADGEIDTPQGKCLLEVKGMGFYYYKLLNEAFEKGGHQAVIERLYEKHQSYVRQCTVTMALSGHRRCYLLVKDRASGTLGLHNEETGERSGIYLEYDDKLWHEILQRFAYVQRKLGEGEPPRPEFTSGSRECGWCEFRYRCHDMMKRQEAGEEPHIVYPGPQFGDYDGHPE